MRGVILRILLTILLAVLAVFISPTEALAVIQNLNGATLQNQSFLNDSNVTISTNPTTGVHSFGWQGYLPISRGGTGVGSFSGGSLLFSNGFTFAENNSKLFWDNTNYRLGIGTSSPTTTLDVLGNAKISGSLEVTGNITSTNLVPYTGATGDLDLGTNQLIAQAITTTQDLNGYNDAGYAFFSDAGVTMTGSISMWDVGQYRFGAGSAFAVFDLSGLTNPDKTYTFPNASGTLGLLEVNQTWNGLNKFEASANSTIYVGSSVKSGCIALGDSDGSGVTYITANDGVLTASTTKPSICQ